MLKKMGEGAGQEVVKKLQTYVYIDFFLFWSEELTPKVCKSIFESLSTFISYPFTLQKSNTLVSAEMVHNVLKTF